MSADEDVTDQAAKTLLGGKGRIEARAAGYTPAEAARRWYGTDTLDAVEAALDDDTVALTDELLAAIRDDGRTDLNAAAEKTNDGDGGQDTDTDDGDTDDGSSGFSATIQSAADFVKRRKKKRDRVEASRKSKGGRTRSGTNTDADDVALAAMDGADRVEANSRGQDPADYIRSEYGLDPSGFDGGDALNAAIMDQRTADRED
jgi:hypothetical protein